MRAGIGEQRRRRDSAIEQNAAGPKQASADGVSVQQHSLPDQIAADKYLAAIGGS